MLNALLNALPCLARISNGYAILSDKKGIVISVVDSRGVELEQYRQMKLDAILKALNKKQINDFKSKFNIHPFILSFPIDAYTITCNNIETINFAYSLEQSIEEILPQIASIIGGDAAICDSDGNVIISVNSKGELNDKLIGKVSASSKSAMLLQKPIIGKSNRVLGATAVRIPIGKYFLFGFNNEDSIRKNTRLIKEVKKRSNTKYTFQDIVGNSEPIMQAKNIASIAAKTDSNVLIYGESGTGKEVFAQSIHSASSRANKPFIAINCAAIPQSLAESIFFGYAEGTFTGAKKGGDIGIFEQANGGTVFLDEIGEMDLNLQSKLLRILQEKEVMRIGSKSTIKLNVRIISATNKDLLELIAGSKFRQDLYYRLNILDIQLPALRFIKEDIPFLVNHFIANMNKDFGKFVEYIEDEALSILMDYSWPGNVRELANCIEKIFNVIGNDRVIKPAYLPANIKKSYSKAKLSSSDLHMSLNTLMAEYEREIIITALQHNDGSKVKTADYLKISTTSLWRKMKMLNIE